jgi:hypothetical protein
LYCSIVAYYEIIDKKVINWGLSRAFEDQFGYVKERLVYNVSLEQSGDNQSEINSFSMILRAVFNIPWLSSDINGWFTT